MAKELRLRVEVEIEETMRVTIRGEERTPTVTRVAVYTSDVGGRLPKRVACDEGEERAHACVAYDDTITSVVVKQGGSSPQWKNSGLPANVRRRVNNLGVLAVQAFSAVNDQLECHEVEDLT